MIHTIREAFNELLADNDWMDDETRAVAKEKADAMNERIGYPKLITAKEQLKKEYAAVSIREKLWSSHISKMVFSINRYKTAYNPYN